jgi:hypothetical protein
MSLKALAGRLVYRTTQDNFLTKNLVQKKCNYTQVLSACRLLTSVAERSYDIIHNLHRIIKFAGSFFVLEEGGYFNKLSVSRPYGRMMR